MVMRTKFDLSLLNSSFRSVFFSRRGRKDYFQLALSVHPEDTTAGAHTHSSARRGTAGLG